MNNALELYKVGELLFDLSTAYEFLPQVRLSTDIMVENLNDLPKESQAIRTTKEYAEAKGIELPQERSFSLNQIVCQLKVEGENDAKIISDIRAENSVKSPYCFHHDTDACLAAASAPPKVKADYFHRLGVDKDDLWIAERTTKVTLNREEYDFNFRIRIKGDSNATISNFAEIGSAIEVYKSGSKDLALITISGKHQENAWVIPHAIGASQQNAVLSRGTSPRMSTTYSLAQLDGGKSILATVECAITP